MTYEYKPFYRRRLPHLHTPGATLFVTFRLAGSIPQTVLRHYTDEKRLLDRYPQTNESALQFRRLWFKRFEAVLDKADAGPRWLGNPAVAEMVAESLHYRDRKAYQLHAYCIMCNHVHVVFTPCLTYESLTDLKSEEGFVSDDPTLPAIMQSLKGYTARQANKILKRSGQFWDEESYDHEVRNDSEFYRIIKYVIDNPVKARLINYWGDWPWTYCEESELFL